MYVSPDATNRTACLTVERLGGDRVFRLRYADESSSSSTAPVARSGARAEPWTVDDVATYLSARSSRSRSGARRHLPARQRVALLDRASPSSAVWRRKSTLAAAFARADVRSFRTMSSH